MLAFRKYKLDDPTNYRIVSVTSVLGRIMENMIQSSMTKTLQVRIINTSQHGFMEIRPCQRNLIPFFEIRSLVHKGSCGDAVLSG